MTLQIQHYWFFATFLALLLLWLCSWKPDWNILMSYSHTNQCVIVPQDVPLPPPFCSPGHCENHQIFTFGEPYTPLRIWKKRCMTPLSITPIQHKISKGLRNFLKLFLGPPWLRVLKSNLSKLENTNMPVLLWELQVQSMKTSGYGWRGEKEERGEF